MRHLEKTDMLAAARMAIMVCLLVAPACKRGLGSGFEGQITLRTTQPGSTQQMVVKAKRDKLRFETTTNGQPATAIFDPAQNKVLLLMEAQKAYTEIDFSAPSAPKGNVDVATAVADKAGTKQTIAGVDCEDWTVKDPSGKHSTVCLADGLSFFDMQGGAGGGSFAKQMREKKQFPLKTVDYDAGGKEIRRTEATKIERTKVDDALFELPAGWTKVALPRGSPPGE